MTQTIDPWRGDQADRHWPSFAIDRLSIGEQLIIWAFRNRLAMGSERALARGFHVAFGLSAVEPALAAFHQVYDTIFHHCVRDLHFHGTRCRCVSHDEMLIVSMIAADHAGMRGQAREICCALVSGQAVQRLIDQASTLSILMDRHHLRLPLRPLMISAEQRPVLLH